MIVVDTSVLVEALRRREPWQSRVRALLEAGTLATTAVNVAELWAGAHSPVQVERVSLILDGVQVLPLDAEAAQVAGAVRRGLRNGRIGADDELIAGICIAHGAPLLTLDQHFSRVAGLTLA